jgi:hypothetical protein
VNASVGKLSARLRESDLVRHGSLVFAGIIVANAFTYMYYALVGRVVGVAGYGVVSALFSATLLIATTPATSRRPSSSGLRLVSTQRTTARNCVGSGT